MKLRRLPYLVCFAALLAGAEAGAVPLLNGYGGADGYGTPDHCVAAGNDNSYAAPGSAAPTPIDLAPAFPEGIRFIGRKVTHFFLNTNGNITFVAPLATPTATAFPIADQPMIAPWWADVDTRGGGSVCFHLEPGLLVATWHDVGSFDAQADRRNDFQLVLSARPACDFPGEFNLDFRYRRCEWVSGDGAMVPAQVGFDAGNRVNYVALPMSRTTAIADVCRLSGRAGGSPGFYRFELGHRFFPKCVAVRPCVVPGRAGLCALGLTRCDGDVQVCEQRRSPVAPICDGLDHDCDGLTDVLCADGQVCNRARCLTRCGPTSPCPGSLACTEGGGCIEPACADVACPSGQRCVGGRCVSVCEGVTCGRGQHCVSSRCVDLCTETTCDPPGFCDDDPASPSRGQCIRRCECEPCSNDRLCGADGRCHGSATEPADAGHLVDAGAIADLGVTADVAPAAPGRLVNASCGCHVGGSASVSRHMLGALAFLAGLAIRRRR